VPAPAGGQPDLFARGIATASLLVSLAALAIGGIRDFMLDRARLKVIAETMTVFGKREGRDVVLVRVTNVGKRDTYLQSLWLAFGRPWRWYARLMWPRLGIRVAVERKFAWLRDRAPRAPWDPGGS
jgi:hypothetical protein